jgi:hypothetical protein
LITGSAHNPAVRCRIPDVSLRERYYQAISFGIIHNRLWDWRDGSHPGHALGTWLRDYKEQVFVSIHGGSGIPE